MMSTLAVESSEHPMHSLSGFTRVERFKTLGKQDFTCEHLKPATARPLVIASNVPASENGRAQGKDCGRSLRSYVVDVSTHPGFLSRRCQRVVVIAANLLLAATNVRGQTKLIPETASLAGEWRSTCGSLVISERSGVTSSACSGTGQIRGDTMLRVVRVSGLSFIGTVKASNGCKNVPIAGIVSGNDTLRLVFPDSVQIYTRPAKRQTALAAVSAPVQFIGSAEDFGSSLYLTVSPVRAQARPAATIPFVIGAELSILKDQCWIEMRLIRRLPRPATIPTALPMLIALHVGRDTLILPTLAPLISEFDAGSGVFGVESTYIVPLSPEQLSALARVPTAILTVAGSTFAVAPVEPERLRYFSFILDSTSALAAGRLPPNQMTPAAVALRRFKAGADLPGVIDTGSAMTVSRTQGIWKSELTPKITQALAQWNPNFRVLAARDVGVEAMPCGGQARCGPQSALPWAASADFNGDRISDVYVVGRDEYALYRTVVWRTRTGMRVEVMSADLEDLRRPLFQEFLAVVQPGRYTTCMTEPLIVSHHGLSVGADGVSYLVFLDGTKWRNENRGC